MQIPVILSCLLAAVTVSVPTTAQAIGPDCEEYCGDVYVPYPFGTKNGCYLNTKFSLVCNKTQDPPVLYMDGYRVLNISLQGQMRVFTYIAMDCYDPQGKSVKRSYSWARGMPFPLSHTRNKFMAVGCDTRASIQDYDREEFVTGCTLVCNNKSSVVDGTCLGIGCCQASIPKGLFGYNFNLGSFRNHTTVSDFNPCSYAVLAEEGSHNFTVHDLQAEYQSPFVHTSFPQVLDWSVGNRSCEEAKKDPSSHACQENSYCIDAESGSGYLCNCSSGFLGNAYIPNGCVNIDECKIGTHNCVEKSTCVDVPGGFNCSCQTGYEGDGKRDGNGCSNIDECSDPALNNCKEGRCTDTDGGFTCSEPPDNLLAIKVSVGTGVGLVVVLLGGFLMSWELKKRRYIRLKEKFFEQNGGLMLQQQLAQRDASTNTMKIFTAEELEKATDKYNDDRIAGRGGYGTVYRGILEDGSVVAIKKSKMFDESQVEQFINEVVVLSQINHRNVVRLLGCCLETPAPTLVYEFITNGTLFEHLHNDGTPARLPWSIRLRIAAETAGVLAYLHSAASTPIIHRDIKSTNILLDESCNARVSDFGASRLVPRDETEISTMVQGTLGYLDPEYLHTSQLTEKSDVYSFGVVLVELMTGQKAVQFNKPENERCLAMYFVSSLRANRFFEILDQGIVQEGGHEQLKEVAHVARRCLEVKGEDRPTMKEVAMELEGLRISEKHPWINVGSNSEETESLLNDQQGDYSYNTNASVGYDSSMNNQLIVTVHDGR